MSDGARAEGDEPRRDILARRILERVDGGGPAGRPRPSMTPAEVLAASGALLRSLAT